MAKRVKLDEEISGYVHHVSPVKKKLSSSSGHSVSYFNMTLQIGKEEFHRGVSYKPHDRDSLQTASTSKSPVKITAVEKPISRLQPGSFDVQLSKASRILMLEKGDIGFKWQEAPSMEAVEEAATLADIASGKISVNKTVVVEVQVQSMEDKGTKIAAGKPISLKTALVADQSSTIELNVWGDADKLDVGKSYKLKANIRSFSDVTNLSLKSGSVVEIKAIEGTSTARSVLDAEIMAARVEKRHACLKCKKTMELSSGSISTCDKCGTKCKNKMVQVHITGSISFDGVKFLDIREDIMKEFTEKNKINQLSTNDIEDFLLEKEKVKVTLLNEQSNTVVKLE